MRDPLREQIEQMRVHHVGAELREAGDMGAQLRAAASMTRGGGPPSSCDRCGQTAAWWIDRRDPDLRWRCAVCEPPPKPIRRGR